MRELKFRAWDGEKMVSPDYITRDGTGYWKENSIPTYSKNVMLWTGMKDRKGKPIYEGDICKSWNLLDGNRKPDLCVVEWSENYYIIKRISTGGSTGLYMPDGEFGVEVIGNIYEKSELLNK